MLDLAEENQISGHQSPFFIRSNEVVPLNNSLQRTENLNTKINLLTIEQLDAYNTMVQYLSGDNGEQMIMFISGEG
jgi:hypothetical protein